nr:hypothetical protein [Tanacetum cinerariifolium]
MTLFNGTCNNCIYRDGKPLTCSGCEGMLRGGFCLPCDLKAEISFKSYQDAYSFDYTSNNSNYLPQPQYKNYLCNLCGNNSHDGYDCQQQFPFVYEQEPSYNQNNDDNYYPHESPSFPCCDNCGGSHETFKCQPMAQNIDFFGFDQIKTPQYPDVYPPSQEMNEEVFQAEGELMKSIQTFLETFICKPFEEKPPILFQAWEFFFAIKYSKPENPNELFQKLLEDLKELAEYENSQKKEEPLQDSDIYKLIREECCIEVSKEQKQSMEDTMLELVKSCQEKELLCIHDNVEDLIESALNSKLLSINLISQRLDNKEQEVKNVVEQPAERGNHIEKSLQNFRVIHKSSISLNTSQISSIHAVAPILSTKEPEHSSSMGYKHSNTTLETESDEIIKSGVEELVPILSENKVTSEDKRECDFPICENTPISSLSDPEIVSVEEENVVHQEEEEIDLEDISQIQDDDLCGKLLSINSLISNIESLNDNPTPDRVLNSSVLIPIFEEFDNSLSDTFSPEFETFCDHTEETRSGNTTHADDSLPEYDSFFFEIDPDQERLINVVKSNISDESSNDLLLEEADLFLASDNSIPPGIENVANDSEGDIRFLEELLIDDFILSHESSDSNFKDNPSIPRPPPEPPDAETDAGEEIPVVMNDKDKFDDDYSYFMFAKVFSFLSAESKYTIFDPGISD